MAAVPVADVMDMDKAERSISRILPVRHPRYWDNNNDVFEYSLGAYFLINEKSAGFRKHLVEFPCRRLRDRVMAADSGSFYSVPDFRSASTQQGGYSLDLGVNDCTALV